MIQPAFGWVLDHTSRDLGGYQVALALPIALAAVGLVAACAAKETRCREQAPDIPAPVRRSD
ncbi:hypothetical protein [Nocardiopsis rhodophaea]|uniref:hypothetical protein n=1 Tax=Nocardiopsis rhodophaea TaxID=280238 RepID=UPI0031D99516